LEQYPTNKTNLDGLIQKLLGKMEDKDSVGTLASEQKDFTFENECLNLFASINEIILSGEIYKSTVSIISKDTINKLEQF
jgi:hypothetical protein